MITTIAHNKDWAALFNGSAAEPYLDVAVQIADAFQTEAPTGEHGVVLLFAYLALILASQKWQQRADEELECVIRRIAVVPSSPGLFHGLSGAGWIVAHVDGMFGRTENDDFEEIDRVLLAHCRGIQEPFIYDLFNGIVGVGIYFLERRGSAIALDGVRAIVDVLYRSCRRAENITWFTPAAVLHSSLRNGHSPYGHFDLGVPHGVAGVIGFLARVLQAGIAVPQGSELLEGAMRWLISKRRADGTYQKYIAESKVAGRSRVAWCYGELGVSVMLLAGARALGNKSFESVAVDVANGAVGRKEESGVFDCGLCHGAAGAAHLFNRLFQATRNDVFREAAEFWCSLVVQNRMVGQGIGGFQAWKQDGRGWQDDVTLLTGSSGIALSLLGASSTVAPSWDGLMLTDLPPEPLVDTQNRPLIDS